MPIEAKPHAWQRPPQPIADIAEEIVSDIVVAGAGVAGVTAAHSAAEAGASVVCLEKFATWSAHGTDIAGINTKIQREAGVVIDAKMAARLVLAWGQQQANSSLIRTYVERSGEMLDRYIDLMREKGYSVRLNSEMTARSDWDALDEKYRMVRSPHLFEIPEGSDLPPHRWNVGYLVREIYEEACRIGARFEFKHEAKQLIKDGERVVGVVALCPDGKHRSYIARKGVILATGGITDNEEMIECFCPIALRADKNENHPRGSNMGDGLVMGKWAGAALSRCYPAPVIHPVNFTVLSPGMNTTWLAVNRDGERFMNEVAYEPLITNARMNAPGNVAYYVWDADFERHFEHQEPNKFRSLDGVDLQAAVQREVDEGNYFKADTIGELAARIGVPADALAATVERYNEMCAAGEDVDFGVPERFLSPVERGPFYASKINAWLLSIPYGLHVDKNSRVCGEDDLPIQGLFAVGNVQGDFFANSYPVSIPGSNNGRSVCFGRLVASSLAEGKLIDGTPVE